MTREWHVPARHVGGCGDTTTVSTEDRGTGSGVVVGITGG
jgi:hypothetical protein